MIYSLKVGFIPPEQFRSPSQTAKAAAEQFAKLQLERATEAGEAISGTELHPIYIFGIDTKTVFDGIVINKRYKDVYLKFIL